MKKTFLLLVLVSFIVFSVQGKFSLKIKALNGTLTSNSQIISYYSIASGEQLQLIAIVTNLTGQTVDDSLTVEWYVDSVYQFTLGDVVSFSQPGLIYFKISSSSGSSVNAIQLTVVTDINDLSSSTLPFPFSNSSNINLNSLRYKIINPLGQIMEQGKFSGEIILRNGNHSLQPGIYFVIYSDALDNRQVLTDKVFMR